MYQRVKAAAHKYDKLLSKLSKQSINYRELKNELKNITTMELDELSIELLGLDFTLNENGTIYLNSRKTPIKEQIFCVTDIECSDSPRKGQIIEIGAVKVKNGEIIDKFESLIHCKNIPENISELTGITPKMLENAPNSKRILSDFRLFLKNSIFVAHNVDFDFLYIAKECIEQLNAPLLNERLCTLALARRCIESERYALAHLKEQFCIDCVSHRALSDAFAAAKILAICLKNLPFNVKTSGDLIAFSKSNIKKFQSKSR